MLKNASFMLCAALVAGAFVGCSPSQPAPDAKADATAATTASAAAATVDPGLKPAAAHETAPAGAEAVKIVTGPVVETMNAANYTYVRVKSDMGDIWAASATFNVKVGDKVVVPLDMPMENFESKSLKRTFPVIYFSSQITKEGETPAAMGGAMGGAMPAMPPGHNPAGAQRATVTVAIPQPAGGTAVAAIWTNRKALAGKPVTVRGMVVKFNGGILGKNWFHLQDGTGTDKDGTNDITVTSAETVKVGDVVTITGTLVLEKDFGSGYAYAVMIEDAKVAPAK